MPFTSAVIMYTPASITFGRFSAMMFITVDTTFTIVSINVGNACAIPCIIISSSLNPASKNNFTLLLHIFSHAWINCPAVSINFGATFKIPATKFDIISLAFDCKAGKF